MEFDLYLDVFIKLIINLRVKITFVDKAINLGGFKLEFILKTKSISLEKCQYLTLF